MNMKTAFVVSWFFFSVLFAYPVLADTETMDVSLIIAEEVPVGALEETLLASGQGLGGFLTAVQNPLVSFVFLIMVSIGILAIFYGFVSALKKAFDTSVLSTELENSKYSIFDEPNRFRENDNSR